MALAWLVTERVREGATLLTRDEMESMVLYDLKTVDTFTHGGGNSDFHSTPPCEVVKIGYLIIFLMQAKWCILATISFTSASVYSPPRAVIHLPLRTT